MVFGGILILAASTESAPGQVARPEGLNTSLASLARYVPREELFGYLEFEGLATHQAAWRASAAYKLLNETKLGALLEDLAGQFIEMAQQSSPPGRRVDAAEIVDAVKHAAQQGFAVGVWGKDPKQPGVVVVLRRGDRPDIRRWLDASARSDQAAAGEDKAGLAPVQKAGRTLHPLDQQGTFWWIEKGDLVLTQRSDKVLAAIDGQVPSAVDHPLRAALSKAEDGFQPAAVGFVEITKLPAMPPDAVKLGLDGLKRVELAWGFQDEALRTVLRAVAPAPRHGLLALLDQPTFDTRSLPPLPAGLNGFTVMSIDLAKTYDQVLDLVKAGDPQAAERIPAAEEMFRQQFGFDVRKDLLSSLGPKLAIYAQAPPAEAGANQAAMMITQLAGLTISVQVRDESVLSRTIAPLMKTVNAIIEALAARARRDPTGAGGAALEFRKKEGPRPTYIMELPPGTLPPPFAEMFRPTVLLGKDQLVVSASTAPAEQAASLSGDRPDQRWQPAEAFVSMIRRLPANLVLLNISDPRTTMPAMIDALPILAQQINAQAGQAQRVEDPQGIRPPFTPLRIDPDKLPRTDELSRLLFPASTALVVDREGASLIGREPIPSLTSPATSGVLVALLLPAVQSAREAARRAQCVNNLKQIGLAYHNYHSANDALPPPAITDKDGKPLLGWRVAILPYIEQVELYNKFKLDEPWDSPHNKALLKEMPPTFLCPSRSNPEPFTTTYRVFVGPGAMFEKGQATSLAHITDGTSNTILVVEAKEAVPWSKPDAELPFDQAAAPSLHGAGSSHPGGFNALFGDGSVRFIKVSINLDVFKALITRAAGEVIGADQF
jgi:prepilin-type processing-associated H-X9-DG protein